MPDWLRPIYDDLREQIMGLNHEIEARPSPMRNGQRRYEAFLLRGRNVIYAHFRRSFIRLNFELPPNHRLPAHEVVKSGERDFRRFELRSKDDLSGAVRLARETIAWVVAR